MKACARRSWWLLAAMVAAVTAGCSDYSRQYDQASSKLSAKEKEAAAMQAEMAALKAENQRCSQQVTTLQGLTPEQKKDAVPSIVELNIIKRSGIYRNESGDRETRLIVYFRPVDDTGDAVKAGGAAHLELWDLGQDPAKSLLAKWDVPAAELKKSWSGSLLADFYRLTFTVPDDYATRQNLTLKVSFTDYLTGGELC